MERITINLSGVTSKDAIQDILVSSLPLPDYYGRNLDALYDCVSTMFIRKRVEITLLGTESVPEELMSYVRGIKKIFSRVASESTQTSDATFIQVKFC